MGDFFIYWGKNGRIFQIYVDFFNNIGKIVKFYEHMINKLKKGMTGKSQINKLKK